MKITFLIILFPYILFSKKIDQQKIELAKRGSNYRVWVYFNDKNESEPLTPSLKTIVRRNNHGYSSDDLWYDLQVSSNYVNQIASMGIIIKNESRWLNAISVICSKLDLSKIVQLPFVKKVEPVLGYKKLYLDKIDGINPSSRDFDYGNAQAQIEQINVHLLHNQGYTGEGVRILLMDTGFDLTHNALDSINVINQWDFINGDSETANETEDEENISQDYHGTAVLSTIAANAPGELVGVAFDAEFLLAKTEDVSQEIQQEEDDYVAGLEWGELNGASVVSTSLGYLDWYEYSDLDGNTAVTTIGVDIAVGLGMVCVTAAGNEGNDDWYYIIAPADADSVISVGAVWENGDIASFSSHGPTADGRIKPEVCARGRQTWCISPNSTVNYSQLSGTSLACPLVGGAVVLIRQARPEWTAMEVREAMMMTASMADSANNTYGHGIVNAAAAIEYVTTSIIDQKDIVPKGFHILDAYPNPFNPSLNIQVFMDKESFVKVDIFSYNGKYIENLFNTKSINLIQTINWNPKNLPSGVYFIRSNVNGIDLFKKVTYIK